MDANDDNTAEPVLRLTDFVDVSTLQTLQDGFASATGIAISFRDSAGKAITKSAAKPRFCELILAGDGGEAACRGSHAEAVKLVEAVDSPCLFECHAGLSQFVAPIVVQERRLGAIIVGDRPRAPLAEAHLAELAGAFDLDLGELSAASEDLIAWSDRRMAAATAFIQQFANTLAEFCHNAHELRCRVGDLATMHDIAVKLAGRTDLQEVLDAATRQLVNTMQLRAAGIRLLDEESGQLRIVSFFSLSPQYVDKGPVLVADSDVDQAALAGQTQYLADVRTDPRTTRREQAVKEGLVSALVTPLATGGRTIGVLRAYMGRVHRFSPFDTVLLEAVASQVATAIINARLLRDVREAARLDRQVKLAAEVQRRMIPAGTPAHSHCEFAAVYEPSSDLGGDFYDFFELPSGEIGFVIADVVGKGVPASLMMASVRSTFRAHAQRIPEVSDLVREVNLRLCEDTLSSEFVTAFYCVLSRDGRRLRYCNAGHEPLLLMRHGAITRFDVGGLVLGLDPAAHYEWGELQVEPDDLLVLVTDGVVEALNYDDEAYGRDRLAASIKLHGSMPGDMPLDLTVKQLFWDVRRFAGLARMSDDITIVATRVR